MANRTVKEAKSIKGTNPQYLVEKIIRTRIYDCQYWKEKCFALSAELLVDEAMSLDHVGGVFGGNIKPTPFICLILKMLQIQPSKDIIIEFIKNPDYKYVRVLGCMYLRLVGTSVECYKYLEPLYSDYRKVKIKNRQGNLTLSHVDEFIDNLLREDRVCDVILPRLQKRHILEETEQVEPRVSALDDDLEGEESEEEEVESEEEEEEVESRRKSRSPRHHQHHSSRSPNRSSRRSRSRSPNRRRSRSRSPYERRNRSRSPRYMTRRRSYSRSPVSRHDRYSRRSPSPYSSSHRHRRRSYSPENRKERRGRDRYDIDEQEEYRSGRDKVHDDRLRRDKVTDDKERRHKEEKKSKKDKKEKKEKKSRKKDKEKTSKSTSSNSNKKELEIQEANELRAKLGIKPLKVD